MHDAFRAALEQWEREGVPANPRAWLVSAGRFKAIDGIRRRARFDAIDDVADVVDAMPAERAGLGSRGHRGRSAAPDLHLLPSGLGTGRADRADAARGMRAHHRGNRARVSHRGADDRPAHRAREGEDPRRAHPVPGALAARVAAAPGERAARDLPGVQRRLLGVVRYASHPARPVRRSDPPRTLDRAVAARRAKLSVSSRCCCCRSRGGRRAPRHPAMSSCSRTRTARDGTAN